MTTIILLNLRFSDFYSAELFKRVKETHAVRLVAVLDQHFRGRIGNHVLPYIDEIYSLQAKTKDGFLAEFDFEKLCEIIEKEMAQSNDIKIVCTDEFNLLHAGHLRRKYNLLGNTDRDMLAFRDKTKMKQLLQSAGIRTPHFRFLQPDDDFFSLSESFGLPFVIKPIDSCGSFGVHIIRNEIDYLKFLNTKKTATAKFEIEEYVDGKLYHVDSCTQDNKITFICANEYTHPNHDYTKGKVLGSIPLKASDKLAKQLIHFTEKALSALGSRTLVNHTEIFVTNEEELIFLEASARPPGAMLNFVHPINFSINLMDEDFFMQTGLRVKLPELVKTENAFWINFPLLPGKIKNFRTPKVESRVIYTYFRAVGDTISQEECNSIVGKAAHAIFYHEDENILRSDFDYIRDFNLLVME